MISQAVAARLSQGSMIRRMFEEGNRLKAIYGADQVFDFSIGNPDLEPPAQVLQAIRQLALDETPGRHGYMSNAGYESTRTAIAGRLSRKSGLAVPAGAVCMTVGAACALNVALKALLDPGDEVLVLAPYFLEYLTYIDNHGGRPVVVRTDPETFLPDPDAIRLALTPRTKALIINSPNNPAGVIYPADLLRRIGEVLRQAPQTVYVLSDEPYAELAYDGAIVPATLACLDNVVICDSWSKSLSLPGERIGFLAVSPRCEDADRLAEAAAFCLRTLGFVNAPAFFQRVIELALEARVDIRRYETRRNMLADILQEAGFNLNRPAGGLYLFPKSPIADDVAFAEACARHRVLLVPGSGFGFPGHVRLCFAASESSIRGSAAAFQAIGREFGVS
ncbi:MAG TPA: pyridoxal phosphate-dependent aminotransferase [Clostridiales bacterium]|nr:pyridoxal phosphate-dependent aminotransferase [Clostridiales bacterium]